MTLRGELMTSSKRERLVLALSFSISNVAVLTFIWLAASLLVGSTGLITLMAVASSLFVWMNLSEKCNASRIVRSGYLLSGAASLYTGLCFLFTLDRDAWPWTLALPLFLFLLADTVVGIAAHILVDGGSN